MASPGAFDGSHHRHTYIASRMRSASNDHEERGWMEHALREAARAPEHDDVPVGAVVVHLSNGEIVARAHNTRERDRDPTAHAELIALRAAARRAGSWRLTDHALVVTLEPCPMCAGAMVQARIARCVYGARDPKKGADGSVYDVLRHPRNNHRIDVVEGVLSSECGSVLTTFFKQRRGVTGRSS